MNNARNYEKNRTRRTGTINSFFPHPISIQSRLIRSFSHLAATNLAAFCEKKLKILRLKLIIARRKDFFPHTEENERFRLIKIQKFRDFFVLYM